MANPEMNSQILGIEVDPTLAKTAGWLLVFAGVVAVLEKHSVVALASLAAGIYVLHQARNQTQ